VEGTIHPLREVVHFTSLGAAAEAVRTEAVDPGWTWFVTSYSFEDTLNACTSARVFIETADYRHPLEEQILPQAAVLYDGDKRSVLTEGDRFGVNFVGPTAGDSLRLYVQGFKLPPGVVLTEHLLAALVGAETWAANTAAAANNYHQAVSASKVGDA